MSKKKDLFLANADSIIGDFEGLEEYEDSRTIEIYVNDILDNKNNITIYNKNNNSYNLLKEDIKHNGILQPILVKVHHNSIDKYEIIAGHNRVHIAKELGIKLIEAKIITPKTEADEYKAKIMLVTTNMTQRERTPIEKANEVGYLKEVLADMKSKGIKVGDNNKYIAKILDITERHVYRLNTVYNAPAEVKQKVKTGEISIKEAAEVIKENTKDANKDIEETVKKQIETKINEKKKKSLEQKALKIYRLLKDMQNNIGEDNEMQKCELSILGDAQNIINEIIGGTKGADSKQ